MKTLEYPVTACILSKEEWEFILAPALRHALPKCGLARNFPRSVLFGPKSHQGLGLIHPYYRQMIVHLQTWMDAHLAKSTTAHLLLGAYEGLRLEIGCPETLGQLDYQRLSTVTTHGWMKSLWQFLWDTNLDVVLHNPYPTLLREADQYLMHIFRDDGQLSGAQLRKLNECRMFLGVITLAEITTIDGTRLDPDAMKGCGVSYIRRKLTWPRQPPTLPPPYWSLWRTTLRRLCSTEFILQQPLGAWKSSAHLQSQWKWWTVHQQNQSVVFGRSDEETWDQFRTITNSRPQPRRGTRHDRGQLFQRQNLEHTPDTQWQQTWIPISITWTSTEHTDLRIIATGEAPGATEQESSHNLYTTQSGGSTEDSMQARERELTQLLTTQCDQENVPLDMFTLPQGTAHQLALALQAGTISAVSDGSFKNACGTAAWIIAAGPDSSAEKMSGGTWVLGGDKDQNSFRSELVGVLGILSCLQALMSVYDVTPGQITIGLDGQAAIDAIQQSRPLRSNQQSADILQCIQSCLHQLPVTWRWIEGHQMEKYHKHLDELDWWGRANTAVDLIAKTHLDLCVASNRSRVNCQMVGEDFAIIHEGVKLARVNFEDLYSDVTLDDICEYWTRKHNISWDDVDTIAWTASARAIRSLPLGLQRWHAKFASGHIGVGKMAQLRKHQSHAQCPRFPAPVETTEHVLTCPSRRAHRQWQRAHDNLQHGLREAKTAPWLEFLMLQCVDAWRQQRQVTCPREAQHSFIAKVFIAQHRISWSNLFLGRLSTEWQESQRQYLDLIKSKASPARWTAAVIRLLLLMAWDMWSDRNDALHGPQGKNAKHLAKDTIHQVRVEYRRGTNGLPASDHHWFSAPLSTLCGHNTTYLQHWLECVSMARLEAAQRPAQTLPRPTTAPGPTRLQQWLASSGRTPHVETPLSG